MPSAAQTVPVSKTMLWAGRILGTLAVLFLLFDAALHLMKPAPVAVAFAQLGYPLDLAVGIGIIELVCVVLYVIPRTSLLGAILLTGYLGGAVASQLRVGHAFFETVFPVIVGVLVWGGLFFRDGRLRAIFPLRSDRPFT
ncbi:MAG: DoxX family protein [Bacillati bacterium ANGP1]|uniref:DoxX family protein n=1 Tax=Candidatus Segetimicrobium genomatis TaxID=2569760 RepID=A0A537K3A0_9BACT|nr:MAG: DoxX family protein [Terrabacteria group bacterium ANGP1]